MVRRNIINLEWRRSNHLEALNSALIIVGAAATGTAIKGADFALWTFIWDNQLQLLTASIGIATALSHFVYVRSFQVKGKNPELRELAAGGHSGNVIYDWFIGRELNPRVTLPLLGTVDLKIFMELRPGMLGWILLDLASIAHQYKTHGYITDSILLITAFQSIYVFDSLVMEPAILTTMDITSDGFGFMLAFGDLVWVPFIYSLQTRYLAMHPVWLGWAGTLGVLGVQFTGYYIFRSANNEKNKFRNNPNDPSIAHLKYMETKSGSKLLISGWWGTARHVNYFGDWFMSWAWCLPTGLAGFIVQQSSPIPIDGAKSPLNSYYASGGREVGTEIVQSEAKGWGMIITYFYVVYFAILLVHRERRDEEKCRRKYGADWDEYCKKVPSRIIPGVY
jgi:Delta14-sterol reductase